MSVDEDGTIVTLTATRSGGTDGAATASVTTTNDTATAGLDFTAASVSVSWADGETGAKTIDITIIDDALAETDETFDVNLTNVIGATPGTNTSSAITIIDDDNVGVIDISPAAVTVAEDDGSVTITATRSGGSDGAASVSIATADGSAAAPGDYTAVAATTLNWADGETGAKTIDVAIIDDALEEGDETLTATLSSFTGATAGTTTSSVITIGANDAPLPVPGVIDISPETADINEDGTSITITATRSAGSDGAASVNIATANGTASAADFMAVNTTLNWADGEAGPKTITIPITDDTDIETDEDFTVTISNPTVAALGTATTSTVTIIDNDDVGVINISPAQHVDEDGSSVTITATRSGGSDGAASVTVTTADGSAAAPGDYTAVNAPLNWADGESGAKTIDITIIDDALVEADENFSVALTNATGASLGTATSSTVTISDNETPGEVNIFPVTVNVGEGDSSINLVVARSGGTDGAISVDVDTIVGTASEADYTPIDTTLNWADGEDDIKAITVLITDDALLEAGEDFTVALSNATVAALGTTNTVSTVTIVDNDDVGVIDITPATVSVAEDGTSVDVTVSRSGGSQGAASVNVDTVAGSATDSADYTAINTTLNWTDGEIGPQTVTLLVADDALVEDDEDLTIELSNFVGSAAGAVTSSSVTITDDEVAGVIDISPTAVSVDEDGTSVTITATRSGGSDGAASVDIATAAGDATAADFTAVDTTLNWTDGEAGPKTVSVAIIDDAALETDEDFTVVLSSPAGAALGAATTSTVTIVDNDDVGVIDISPAIVSVDEDGSSVTITATRSGGSDGAASVNVASADDTATGGADYTALDVTLNWADGETGAKTATLFITDDGLVEDDETLTVELTNFVGAAAGDSTTSTVTIIDDEVPGVIDISPATVSIAENGSSISVTITRSGGTDGPASVQVSTVDGTATGGSDYLSLNNTVLWADGQNGPRTVTVFITNDELGENDETFSVALDNFVGAVPGAVTTSKVTILDDDGVGELSLSPATLEIAEQAGEAVFTVTRSNGSEGAASVRFSTSNGTATAPSDYSTRSLIATWAAGESGAKEIKVPIVDDSIDDDNETFTVTLSNPSGAELSSATSSAVTIIDNDDPVVVNPNEDPTSFVTSVEPARVVDTRAPGGVTSDGRYAEIGKIEAGETLTVNMANRAGVPDDAKAVVVNVTSVRGNGIGFLTVHPCLEKVPGASSLNFDGSSTPNEIITGLSHLGQLCVFSSADTDVLIDVVGYFDADSAYDPLAPARLLETRSGQPTVDGTAAGIGSLSAGQTYELDVVNRAGVSPDATAVVINVTSIKAPNNGFVTLHPCLPKEPGASSLNFTAGTNRANEVIAEVSDKGTVCIFASSETGLLIDVVGQLTSDVDYTPVPPARLVDSRAAGATIDGLQRRIGRQVDGAKLTVQVAGRANVPADAEGVVVNITAVRPAGTGFFTTYDCGAVPTASSLNYSAATVANEIIVELNNDGEFCVFTSRNTDLLIDVVGAL